MTAACLPQPATTPLEAREALGVLVAAGEGESDAALALRWKIALALEPFVAQRARRVARRDPEGAADLTQTALAELVTAAHTWDPALGALTTWGQWRLRPILDRAAHAQLGEAAPRVGPAYRQAAQQVDGLRSLGDSLESACEAAKISPASYQAARDAARPAVRLDAPVPGGEEGDVRQIDRLTDGGDPEAAILAGIERAAVRAALEALEPRTRQIVEDHLSGQTYAEIAAGLGLSRGRVQQIVLAAIRQLREQLGITPGPRERQQEGAREGARRRRARTTARAEALTGDPETPRKRCWIVDAGAACTRRVDRRGLCESHAQIAARHGRLEQLSRPRPDGQPYSPRGCPRGKSRGGALGGRVSAERRRAQAGARIATWIPDPDAPRSRCWLIDAGVPCEAPVDRRGLCARHSRALDRAGPDALDRLSRPRKSPESARTTRPPRAALPSAPVEGEATERSAAPVEVQAEPPAVAVAGSEEVGRDLPAQEPLATAGGQPTSTPDPWDSPEGRTYSEESMSHAATAPPAVDPAPPEGRCRLQGCQRTANVRGICLPCYDRARRHGYLAEVALPPIPRGRGTRYQRQRVEPPAPEAPAPRHAGEALRAIWVALGSPELAQPESPELEILRAAEQRLRLDAQLSSRITELEEDGLRLRAQLDGQIQLTTDRVLQREQARADADALRARVEELEIVQAAATTARVRLAEILQEPTSTPWRQLLDQVEGLEGEAAAAQLARTRAFEERAELICSLLEALGGPPLAPGRTTWRQEDLVGEVRRLRASADHILDAIRVLSAAVLDPAQEWGGQPYTDDHATLPQAVALAVSTLGRAKGKIDDLQLSLAEATREVDNLRGALAACAGQDLTDQTAADLIASATSEVQRLREGWRWAAEDARQTAQALDVARRQVVAAPETPESLERRYQALQTARRLRDLLEGRAETRVQLPTGEIVGLQEIWLWDLLAPLLPGEIERLEREAGVSRG